MMIFKPEYSTTTNVILSIHEVYQHTELLTVIK